MTANGFLWSLSSTADSIPNGITGFVTPGGANPGVGGGSGSQGWAQIVFSIAGTISNFSIFVSSNNTGATSTAHVFHNGATGNGSLSFPGTGSFTDAVHTDVIASGDSGGFKASCGGVVGGIVITGYTATYEGTNCASPLTCVSNGISGLNFAGSSPEYVQFGSRATSTSWFPSTGTSTMPSVSLSGLFGNIGPAVGGSGGGTVTTSINGSAGTNTFSFVNGTGMIHDTTHTDAVAAGQLVNASVAFSSTTVIVNNVGIWQSTPQGLPFYVGGGSAPTFNYAAGTDAFTCLGGRCSANTSEASAKSYVPFAWRWSNLGLVVTANTVSGSTSYHSRVNGVDANQSLSIGSALTGTFQDAVHTDTLTAGNLANQRFSSTGATGTLTMSEVFNYFTHPGSVFNVSTAETLSLADSPSDTTSFNVGVAETLTLVDVDDTTGFFGVATNETLALSDQSLIPGEIVVAATFESLALADLADAVVVSQVFQPQRLNGLRTYGRVRDSLGNASWVIVTTDADGFNDLVYLVTLIQALKLNLNESPFFANYGIPAKQSVIQQIFPDFYVSRTQQQFAQYFASLIISKRSGPTPMYDVHVTTHQGFKLRATVPT